jgi:hypothetical protein
MASQEMIERGILQLPSARAKDVPADKKNKNDNPTKRKAKADVDQNGRAPKMPKHEDAKSSKAAAARIQQKAGDTGKVKVIDAEPSDMKSHGTIEQAKKSNLPANSGSQAPKTTSTPETTASDVLKSTVQRTTNFSQATWLQNGHVIVAGAGIIGLCLAYELKSRVKVFGAAANLDVTVIEATQAPCELASGHCAGILSIEGLDEDAFGDLMKLSLKVWREYASSPQFREATEMVQSQVFHVQRSNDEGRAPERAETSNRTPSWYQAAETETIVETEEHALGKL